MADGREPILEYQFRRPVNAGLGWRRWIAITVVLLLSGISLMAAFTGNYHLSELRHRIGFTIATTTFAVAAILLLRRRGIPNCGVGDGR